MPEFKKLSPAEVEAILAQEKNLRFVTLNTTPGLTASFDQPEVLYRGQGQICWKVPGNTEEENEQLAIRNIQGLFLKKFPEFNELFPRTDGAIREDKREDAEKFVIDKVGTKEKFFSALCQSPLSSVSVFKKSIRVTLEKSFGPWGVEFSSFSKPPEGWITNKRLSRGQLSMSGKLVKDVADKYKLNHPEWYRGYFDERGSLRIHYSPQLVEQIKKELTIYNSPPEGWVANSTLSTELRISKYRTEDIANKLRETNPEGFREFRRVNGVREYYSPEIVVKTKEELSKYNPPPEGWVSMKTLESKVKKYRTSIKPIIDRYRIDHPEWFEIFWKKRFVEHYSPELQVILNQELPKFDEPPKGWINNFAIKGKLGVSERKVKTVAHRFKESNPEWYKEYRRAGGNPTVYYSPELLIKITEELLKYNTHPEGWFTNSYVSDKLGVGFKTVRLIANKHQKDHPEWFGKFRGVTNHIVAEFYSPELVTRITKEVIKFTTPPEGWIPNGPLSMQLKSDEVTVNIIAGGFKKDHPEWFQIFRNKTRTSVHYSPELVSEITRIVKEIKEQKEKNKISLEEAENPEVLYDSRGRVQWKLPENTPEQNEQLAIRNIQGLFLKKFPEFNDLFPRKDGTIEEDKIKDASRFILEKIGPKKQFRLVIPSSALVARQVPYFESSLHVLREKSFAPWGIIFKGESAPEGWYTRGFLSAHYGVGDELMQKILQKFKNQRPDWFQKYLDSSNRLREHISQQAQHAIESELSVYKAPPSVDWYTNKSLSKKAGVDSKTVRRIAKQYRDSHPEWFDKYKTRAGVIEHYSPELVSKIRQELSRYDSQPEGWFTNSFLANQSATHFSFVKEIAERFREKHPEWFVNHKGSNGKILEYYSPELVNEITRIVKERREKKEKDNITPEEADRMFKELMGV